MKEIEVNQEGKKGLRYFHKSMMKTKRKYRKLFRFRKKEMS